MEASSAPGAPATGTKAKRRDLCPVNQKLLRKWIVDISSRSSKPSLDDKRKILAEIQKRDPWYKLKRINSRIQRRWRRTARENQRSDAANSPPSNFTIDVTKAIRTVLHERPDPSDEHINAWATSLGIEDDVLKAYVKWLRDENGTANGCGSSTRAKDDSNETGSPPHIPCGEPGSPQSEVSTVVPKHRARSLTVLSHGGVPYTSSSKAASLLIGPCSGPELRQQCPAVSYSPIVANSSGHVRDEDAWVSITHSSPSTSTLCVDSDCINTLSQRSSSPSNATRHDFSQASAHNGVLAAYGETHFETPAQMNTPPAMSATDPVDFATAHGSDYPAPVRDVVPDENVTRLPSFKETFGVEDDSDADAPTTTEEFIHKFKPYSDSMDSVLLRLRPTRRDSVPMR